MKNVPRSAYLIMAILSLASCSGDSPVEVSGQPAQTVAISIGEELGITLGTAGPGEYVTPPALQGESVTFMDMSYPDTRQPGGISQLFRFRGVQSGQTIIQFHNTSPAGSIHPDVVDTVQVR
jgi:hypothetical protein